MAGEKGNTLKMRISYKKGSQTLNQCKLAAKDSDLLAVAKAITDLRKDTESQVTKIAESDLVL